MSHPKDPIRVQRHHAPNDDGWLLHLRQTWSTEHLVPQRRPVLIVPGYGMNAFIFGFHPRGTSMERHLAQAGFEVWSVDLRRQGNSRPQTRKGPPPSMLAYADTDLTAAIRFLLSHTNSLATQVDAVGCSLGGSILYGHLALHPHHRIHSVVTVGSPMRWDDAPLLFRLVMGSPSLVGRIPVFGARAMAAQALPMLARVPSVLTPYMNPAHVDLSRVAELVQTVEDPHPRVNRDIAEWIRDRDLTLRGINVSDAMQRQDQPLLVVVSNRDGIVPDAAALSVLHYWGGPRPEMLRIGTDEDWYAHADLFIANDAPAHVFDPIGNWLLAQG